MDIKRGHIRYNKNRNEFFINRMETLSLIVNQYILDTLVSNQDSFSGKLLDVGCGKKPYSLIYEKLVDKSFGTEVSYSLHGHNYTDVICFAERMPFPKNSFDTVLCTEVLEHTINPFVVMEEISRLLRTGGRLILSVPFIYPLHEEPHDYWRFSIYGLRNLTQKNNIKIVDYDFKGGISATLISFLTAIFVRSLNLISKIMKLQKPLRDRKLIRYLILLPQQLYIWCVHLVRKTFPRINSSKLDEWMTTGIIIIAEKM